MGTPLHNIDDDPTLLFIPKASRASAPEPSGGDAALRAAMRAEIGSLLEELGFPVPMSLNPRKAAQKVGDVHPDDSPETTDVNGLTALLGLNRKTVYNLITLGQIPGVRRMGRRIVVHRETVLSWLRNGQGSVPRSRRKP